MEHRTCKAMSVTFWEFSLWRGELGGIGRASPGKESGSCCCWFTGTGGEKFGTTVRCVSDGFAKVVVACL